MNSNELEQQRLEMPSDPTPFELVQLAISLGHAGEFQCDGDEEQWREALAHAREVWLAAQSVISEQLVASGLDAEERRLKADAKLSDGFEPGEVVSWNDPRLHRRLGELRKKLETPADVGTRLYDRYAARMKAERKPVKSKSQGVCIEEALKMAGGEDRRATMAAASRK